MKKILLSAGLSAVVLAGCGGVEHKDQRSQEFQISKADLMNKIKGGWAGQVIGVCYALPTEFKYQKRIIPDSIQMNLTGEYIKEYFNNDDIYVDAKFVEVIGRSGFDAPAETFGLEFANAGFHLWGANQRARYNILQGIMPPASGHWKNQTASGQIDFQIEADFAGLTTAGGSLDATVDLADRVGHIMNYGDGWYSGVFVASMYSLAFIYDDVEVIINEALKLIPEESGFHKAMSDVISMHKQYPDDWKTAWHEIEKRDWSYELHYPFGVYSAFSMDATLNMAYVLVGMLYGEGDFFNSMDISMRCGQDSDCNPASVGGVLGTILGYDKIPADLLAAYKDVEDVTLNYTTVSLNDCYDICYKSSLDNIVKAGGKVDGDLITINYKSPDALPLEVAYPNIYPTDKIAVGKPLQKVGRIDFSGTGIAIMGGPNFRKLGREDHKLQDYAAKVEVTIDGKQAAIRNLPFSYHARTDVEIYFNFELPKGPHYLELTWLNPIEGAELSVREYITYSDEIVWKEIKPRDPGKLKFPHPEHL